MTCIVGVVEDGVVTIGGDSAGVAGYGLTVRADSKVFTRGAYVFGFTSSFRMGQLLRYAVDLPTPPKRRLDAFMVTTFVDSLREAFHAGGYATKENNVETGGTFLVGVAGRLFAIHDDYQVGEARAGYDAVGCGEDVALGALFATGHLSARRRARTALEAAERHSAGVRGPFVVRSVTS